MAFGRRSEGPVRNIRIGGDVGGGERRERERKAEWRAEVSWVRRGRRMAGGEGREGR